ncbi:hypothetical protein [Luteolibacter sp. Populi]|uniref:hypothetical protein n=1 Tax=Luteolibacter sp. Populi TaxID=3230487 RepID=UPI00346591E0
MKNTATIGIAALLAGAAGGYLAGKAGVSEDNKAIEAKAEALSSGKTTRTTSTAASENVKGPRDVRDALSKPSQLSRMEALMDLYAGMGADQLKSEAEKLASLSGAERMMASFLLFGRWGEVDPQGALAYSNTIGFGGAFARPTILQSWASSDPENAAKYFSENPNEFRGMGGPGGGGFGGGDGAGVIAAEWAKLDPEAALTWAKGLTGRDKGAALNSVIGQMAATDPTKAAGIAATLDAEDQPRAYSEIAGKWGTTDFAAAEAWIGTLPADARDRAMASALESYANTDPAAASLKVANMAAGEQRDEAVGNIAEAWARKDPSKAALWVAQQQSEDIDDAIRPVIATWTGSDSAGALAFIQSQPQGELRDEATSTYIWSNRNGDPQTSLQLAESISDEGNRNRSIGMSVMRWMEQDRAAATAYVQSSTSLNEETKQRLIEGRGWGGNRRRGGN